jgi:LAO/AO transport system kinase
VQIIKTEAVRGEGVAKLVDALEDHRARIAEEGTLTERRRRNLMNEVVALAGARMQAALAAGIRDDQAVQELLDAVVSRRLDPASAAREILAGGVISELRFGDHDRRLERATLEGDE